MIRAHIPKIVMICLLRNISTIQEFEKEIKKALQENDEDFLDMIGKGVDMIPLYIGDDKQIDRAFINRWIDKNNRLTSNKSGFEGFKKRYDVINTKMDITKLSESIVFDPLELTNEMCSKIKEPLKKAKRILILDKSGSFLYSVLSEIEYHNLENIVLITPENLSREIIKYLLGKDAKLIDIELIKDTEDFQKIKNMPKFDVVVGNPPYTGNIKERRSGPGNSIWPKFVELSFDSLKEGGYLTLVHPITWRLRTKNKYLKSLRENQIIFAKLAVTPFKGIGAYVDWYVSQKKSPYKKSTIHFLDGEYDVNVTFPLYSYNNPIAKSILKKVLTEENNGLFMRSGFANLVKEDKTKPKGNYKYAYGARYEKDEWKYHEYPHIHQFLPKVIMSSMRKFRPFYDEGKIGIEDHTHYILVKNKKEADFFINIINSDLGLFLQKMFTIDFWDPKTIARYNNAFPYSKIKISEENIDTEEKMYKHFHLTREEIEYLKNSIS